MVRFTTPPNRNDFHEAVWEMVERIPRGRVCIYGCIAELVGPPAGMEPRTFQTFGARWVGGAMAHCPEGVPWWRVINAQGKISAREGDVRQRKLLEDEGVVFSASGRVDLAIFRWTDGS